MVKNRYMTQPDISPKKFPTPTSVAKFVYKTEGLQGFYRGIGSDRVCIYIYIMY
jgi:solute carrier family 25 carnitine/acylcarnitine transporter 20/29